MLLNQPDLQTQQEVIFFTEGDEYYRKFLQMIASAKVSIYLQTYIFEMDKFGEQVYNALLTVPRSVQVYVLIDGFGSNNFADVYEKKLLEAGIKFKIFNKIKLNNFGKWTRRIHHKVLLIDGSEAMVGGINVISDYLSGKARTPNLDFAIYIKGSAVTVLLDYCQMIFGIANIKKRFFKLGIKFQNRVSTFSQLNSVAVSINDWMKRRGQITQRYKHLIESAQHEIILVHSYFFPSIRFMSHLIRARRRGVSVKMILPMYSDWPSFIVGSQFLYTRLLRNNIEIYHWNKSILHGKLILTDKTFLSVGSFNLNLTSYQQNTEINIDVHSQEFAQQVHTQLLDYIKTGCTKIQMKKFLQDSTFFNNLMMLTMYLVIKFSSGFTAIIVFLENRFKQDKW
ncbi:hypothetical protein K2P97_12715 [bacterium]|nr:hypothetical protein [bacterium]